MPTALVIDDDKGVAFLHQVILEECNLPWKILSFTEPNTALEYLIENSKSDNYFILFLDINMPVMDGWKFLQELRRYFTPEKVKVVMVTSSIDKKDKEQASTYDTVVGFIEKPLTIDVLQNLINQPEIRPFLGLGG